MASSGQKRTGQPQGQRTIRPQVSGVLRLRNTAVGVPEFRARLLVLRSRGCISLTFPRAHTPFSSWQGAHRFLMTLPLEVLSSVHTACTHAPEGLCGSRQGRYHQLSTASSQDLRREVGPGCPAFSCSEPSPRLPFPFLGFLPWPGDSHPVTSIKNGGLCIYPFISTSPV